MILSQTSFSIELSDDGLIEGIAGAFSIFLKLRNGDQVVFPFDVEL